MKRRVFTINGKIPTIGGNGEADNNEYNISKPAKYYTVNLAKISDSLYVSTFSASENYEIVTIPEGIEVATCTQVENSTHTYNRSVKKGTIIPAYSGVLISGNAQLSVTFRTTSANPKIGLANNLIGVAEPMDLEKRQEIYGTNAVFYAAAKQDTGGVGWSKVSDKLNLVPGKAFLLSYE